MRVPLENLWGTGWRKICNELVNICLWACECFDEDSFLFIDASKVLMEAKKN